MTDTYSIEQIDAAACKASGNLPCLDEHEHTRDWFASFKAELTKPEWKPAVGQVVSGELPGKMRPYFRFSSMDGDKYRLLTGESSYGNYASCRPLTPPEAGEEPMKHLLDALDWIEGYSLGNNLTNIHRVVQQAIDKHAELMK